MRSKIVLALVVVLVSMSTVSATIVNDNAPFWRGDDNTTSQAWEFTDGSNPAIAEVGAPWDNPYGTPTAEIRGFMDLEAWYPEYQGEDGVWGLAQITPIDLIIPNTDNTGPDTWKEIWLQITYLDPYGDGYNLPIDVAPDFDSLTRVSHQQLASGYWHDTYSIIVIPNPLEETITLRTIQCVLYIDEIIVDTICIPEPMTVALLGLGGLLLCRKK